MDCHLQPLVLSIFHLNLTKVLVCAPPQASKIAKIWRRAITSTSIYVHLQEIATEKLQNSQNQLKLLIQLQEKTQPSYLKCLNGWSITLRASSDLWIKLSKDFNVVFLVTRQLNQDSLENHIWFH